MNDRRTDESKGAIDAKEPKLPRPRRRSPRMTANAEGVVEVQVTDEAQLRELFGVKTDAAADGLLMAALNALGVNGRKYRELIVAMAEEVEPRDAIEAMLVSQQVATHVAMMSLSGKVSDATSPQLRESYERSMTRLSRTFLAQVEGLKKYRAKAQQTVRVERVEVYDGGQAVVGCVSAGGRGNGRRRR